MSRSSKITLFLSFMIFVYIVMRSVHVPLHYDEILNYFMFAETGRFQPFVAKTDANNHVISTAFNHLMYLIFGNKLVFMRLPNTLFFLLYFTYLWKFKKFFLHEWIGNCFLLTMIGSFFLLSFFSMARGYSFSMAFLIAGCYHLYCYIKNNASYLNLLLICLYGGLTIWSNLALLPLQMTIYFLVALSFVTLLKRKAYLTLVYSSLILIIVGGIPTLFAAFYSLHLKETGALYLGTADNFYSAVWMDLPTYIFSNLYWGQIITAAGIILFLIVLSFQFRKLKLSAELTIAAVLFAGAFGSAILLHTFFDVNYPQNRAALHFIIVSLLLFYLLADQLDSFWNKIAYYPVLLTLAHTTSTLNLSYHAIWKNESFDEEHYKVIAECQKNKNELLTISAPGYFGRVLDQYNFQYNYNVNTFQESDYPSSYADILITSHLIKIPHPENYDTLISNPITGTTVLEKKNKITWKKIDEMKHESFTSNSPYIIIDTLWVTPDSGSNLKVEYFIDLWSEEEPCDAWLIVTCESESKKYSKVEYVEIQRMIDDYQTFKSIHKAYYFTNLTNESTLVSVYIWNIKNTNWKVNEGHSIVYENIR